MKRMTTLLAAGLMALFAAPAVWAEFTLYGSVRSGVYYQDPKGADATWDLGSVDAGDLDSGDKLWSRIGVRASYDLDGGMTSGLHIEKRLDNFRTRHQNVWLQGGIGRLTLGQQGVPFFSAVTWDGAYFLGGAYDPGSRARAITYATSTGGPFNATVGVSDDNSGSGGQGNGFDNYQVTGAFKLSDAFSITAGYTKDKGADGNWGSSIQGSVADLSWDAGYIRNHGTATTYGAHVGFAGAYAQYSKQKDVDDVFVVGYGHPLGPNTWLIGEYRSKYISLEEGAPMNNAATGVLALRVDF